MLSRAIMLYPQGQTKQDGKWLSIYLFSAESESLAEDEKIFAQGHIRILDPVGLNNFSRERTSYDNCLLHYSFFFT